MVMRMLARLLIVSCVSALWVAPAMAASTLQEVQSEGALRCGVVVTPEDWNKDDLHGPLAPLSTEICKAVSVAVLGAKAKVNLKPYTSERAAEQGLSKSEVQVIVGVTPDASAMWQWKIRFGPPVFYDGQQVLVRRDDKAKSFADLGGVGVCYIEGTDNDTVLQAQAHIRHVALNPMPYQEEGEMDDGLAVRHCDAITALVSRLAAVKVAYPKQIGGDRILPDILTLSPVAPAYRQGDAQWGMIVDWTIYALIQAEASGVTQANVAEERKSEDPVVQRLLGVDWAASRALGLTAHDWAAQVISVVGNYGEIYDRTVGMHSPLKLPRGLNALWTQGGLMHPLPVQ